MQTFRLWFRFVACVVASACLSGAVQAENWPTTRFVLHNVDPSSAMPRVVGELRGFSLEQQPAVAEYEKYLSEVAVYYQSMGFTAPRLAMTKSGERAYIAYLYDFDGGGGTTAMAGYLGDGTIDLRVDLSRAIVNGKTVDRTFEDLAHELFHNIQRSYQLSYEWDHGSWIMEGQAQALGMEAAKRLRGIEVNKGGNTEAYWLGSRGYYRPLATETKDENYRTASFWRYIGEHVAAARMNGRAGVDLTTPDYSYLAKIYGRHPFKGPVSVAGDLQWLDNALENEVGLGLDRLYPNFVATFAAYVPARLSVPPPSAQQARDTWLKLIFDLCPSVALNSGNPSGSVTAALRKNASRCFKADFSGTGRFDLSIQVHASTAKSLEDLHIGMANGTKVSPPKIVVSPSGGGYIGHWRFRVPAATAQAFIVSNMAAEPATSLNQDIVLNLTASQWDSSMTTPTPQAQPKPQRPPAQRGAESGAAAPDATREANRDDLETGLAALSNQTATGARAVFNRDFPRCNQPFALLGCGPNTTIQLALTSGSFGDLSQTSATGGEFSQILGNLTAIADHGIDQTNEALLAAYRKMKGMEGAEISIVIPAIEYGFTGSFSNAHIGVTGANDEGGFRSVDAQGQHNGQVVIEEFTPFVLRGRFAAELSRPVKPDGARTDHRSLSGRFVIAAPWENDRDVTPYVSGTDPARSVIQDVTETMPGIGSLGSTAAPTAHSSSDAPGSPVGPAVGFPVCPCACEPSPSLAPACGSICAVTVRHCAEQATQQAALEEAQAKQTELDALEGDVDRMRADFTAYLRANMPHMMDTVLGTFDEQPTAEAKRFMMFTYGLPIDDYGK